jgi:hypothetical protein
VLRDLLRSLRPRRRRPGPATVTAPPVTGRRPVGSRRRTAYAGDFTGRATLAYEPRPDDRPDPGEVVWAWVPFEENHRRGKDRPVLVVGRDGDLLLALMLTSHDHLDLAAEARRGRHWVDLGPGEWDRSGRPSEVRVDRVLRLNPDAVRRIGAVLDRARYDAVTRAARRVLGW